MESIMPKWPAVNRLTTPTPCSIYLSASSTTMRESRPPPPTSSMHDRSTRSHASSAPRLRLADLTARHVYDYIDTFSAHLKQASAARIGLRR